MPWKTPPGAGATVFIWSGYSLAERDRRWKAVRENAAKAGFDTSRPHHFHPFTPHLPSPLGSFSGH